MKTFVFALLLAGGYAAVAETPEQIAAGLGRVALTNSGAMGIVRNLTTDVGPRLAGSEAEKRAAAWAKQRFEQLGFDKVWVESFALEHSWERGIETAEIVSPSPQRLVITALGDSVATPPEGIIADIALFKTYDEFLGAPTNSLRGKIVVVTERMARARDGRGYGEINKMRNRGPAEAAQRGAIAYLLRSLATDNHRMRTCRAYEFSEGRSANSGGGVVCAGCGAVGTAGGKRRAGARQAGADAANSWARHEPECCR